jgi:hypothetical protein
MQISMTSTYSAMQSNTAVDFFALTLQEGCISNKLLMDSGSLAFTSGGSIIPNQVYKVSNAANATPAL